MDMEVQHRICILCGNNFEKENTGCLCLNCNMDITEAAKEFDKVRSKDLFDKNSKSERVNFIDMKIYSLKEK